MVRTRAGIAAVTTGVLGLALAWWIVDSAGVSGAFGTVSAIVLATGLLLVAPAGGEVATRITGGLLCVAGLAVAVTQHQLWWWLRTGWEAPMTVASLLIALVGLGVLLFAYGFRMAGLSGACGVLAAACLAAVPLPYIGSEDEAVLRAAAAALGAVALVAGFRAAVKPPLAGSLAVRGALIVAAAVAVAFVGYDAYGTYAPTGYRAATITATILGVVGVLVVGIVTLPGPAGSPGRTEAAGSSGRPEPARSSGRTEGAVVDSAPSSAVEEAGARTAPAAGGTGGRSLRGSLETISLAVGVIIGLITILKEVVAAVRALAG